MRRFLPVLTILLAACGTGPGDGEPADQVAETAETSSQPVALPSNASALVVSLVAEGLRLVDPETGRTYPLDFGVTRKVAEQAVIRALGEPDGRSDNDECPAGPMAFTDFGPFRLNFQNDTFEGWSLGQGKGADRFTTFNGIGIGTTRAKAEESSTVTMFTDSTLGDEFQLAPQPEDRTISGLFSGSSQGATIEDLWSGVPCNFR